jgi:hypothetical protein
MHAGITFNMPGVPVPLPLESFQQIASALGYVQAHPAAACSVPEPGAACEPPAAAAAAAGISSYAAAEEHEQQQQQQFSWFRKGSGDESSRKAAMACGISAAAAGSGAVPAGKTGGAAGAGVTGGQTAAQARRKKPKGKAVVITAPAAAAPDTAVAKRVSQALPQFSSLRTVSVLWSCYSKGYNGGQAWEVQEQQGPEWRQGERKRWCELKKVIDEVK